MSNKVARTFAFFYTLLVHLLVFLVSSEGMETSPSMLQLENYTRFGSTVYYEKGPCVFDTCRWGDEIKIAEGWKLGKVVVKLCPDNGKLWKSVN